MSEYQPRFKDKPTLEDLEKASNILSGILSKVTREYLLAMDEAVDIQGLQVGARVRDGWVALEFSGIRQETLQLLLDKEAGFKGKIASAYVNAINSAFEELEIFPNLNRENLQVLSVTAEGLELRVQAVSQEYERYRQIASDAVNNAQVAVEQELGKKLSEEDFRDPKIQRKLEVAIIKYKDEAGVSHTPDPHLGIVGDRERDLTRYLIGEMLCLPVSKVSPTLLAADVGAGAPPPGKGKSGIA